MSSKNETYYVVKKGHKPGIYKTWPECKQAVEGYKGPIYKKFMSFEEANAFYKSTDQISRNCQDHNISKIELSTANNDSRKTSIPFEELNKIKLISSKIKCSPFSNDFNYNVEKWNCIDNDIYIFTDGSSRNNKEYYNSGIGIYLGYECINIKEIYNNRTNNQCELQAMDIAFKLILNHYNQLSQLGHVIKIVSDSEYSIKACSLWLQNWKNNNWKTSNGEDVKNRELIESIDTSMTHIKLQNSQLEDSRKVKVKLIHVNSHQNPDFTDKFKYNIWFGNYIADQLSQNKIPS